MGHMQPLTPFNGELKPRMAMVNMLMSPPWSMVNMISPFMLAFVLSS